MNNKLLYLLFAFSLLLAGCGGGGSSSDSGSNNSGQPMQSTQTLVHDGLSREYILYVPAAYDGTRDVPLLFNFHGFSQTMNEHIVTADMRALADANNFILVYPQGAYVQTLLGSVSQWNANASPNAADDLGFIETLIGRLSLEYQVDAKRVYATGFSNGGMLSYALACYKSDLIAAVGVVGGTQLDLSANCAPTHPTATVSIHGTSDLLVPYNGSALYPAVATVLDFWRNDNNTNATPVTNTESNNGTPIERFQYSGGSAGVSVVHYKVVGGGHSWFDLNYQGSGTNALLWDFLSQYDVDGLRSN